MLQGQGLLCIHSGFLQVSFLLLLHINVRFVAIVPREARATESSASNENFSTQVAHATLDSTALVRAGHMAVPIKSEEV